ncbi:MAG: P1 family peptidase, partial [Pseudomonadota bacterium]
MRNLITDVAGIFVGHADDPAGRTGVTVVRAPTGGAHAAVDVRGGGPGTRETDALGPAGTVEVAHAVVLAGGSAFGLAAASGAQDILASRGIGFSVGAARVPIVPAAVVFELLNGGARPEALAHHYATLGAAAAENAFAADPGTSRLGTVGAGYGATTARYCGGLGEASTQTSDGTVVGALAVVNPVGCVTQNASDPRFWASDLEQADEFASSQWAGDARWSSHAAEVSQQPPLKGHAVGARENVGGVHGAARADTIGRTNTIVAVVATDAPLGKAQCQRLAIMAQTGLARAVWPTHTPLDGDVVFALATGRHDRTQDNSLPGG